VCCIVKQRRRKSTLVEERVGERSRVSQVRRQGHYGMSLCPIQRSREPELSSGDSRRCSLVQGIGGVPKPRIEMLWVCEH
jgi:hypothetical protein